MSTNAKNSYLFILLILVFSFQTFGFDLFHHTLCVVNFSSITAINYDYILFSYLIPRYIYFHYLLYIPSFFGIPVVLTLVITQMVVLKNLFNSIQNTSTFIYYLIVFISFILSLFWAPISLAVLLLITYYFTKNNKFLLFALLLHPIGLMLGTILAIFEKKFRTLIIAFALILLLIYVVNNFFSNDKCIALVYLYRDLDNAGSEYITENILKKWREMLALGIVVLFGYFSRKPTRNKTKNFKKQPILLVYTILVFFSGLFSLNKQINQKSLGFYSVFIYNYDTRSQSVLSQAWLGTGVPDNDVCSLAYYRQIQNN